MANNTEDYVRSCQRIYNLLRSDNNQGALAKLPAGGVECEQQVADSVAELRELLGTDDLPA